jgi:dipeptidyl-peptidase-4
MPSNPTSSGGDVLLTNDVIHNSGTYNPAPNPSVRWLADGENYTALEKPPDALDETESIATSSGSSAHDEGADAVLKIVREIVQYNASTGERSVLVGLGALTPPGSSEPLDIQDYSWSDDGTALLVFTNSHKVWRQNTRGDYYVVDLSGAGAPIKKVGGDADAQCLMYAKFSPGSGDRVGYVYHNNIYVQDLASMAITQLTEDGLPGHGGMAPVINGNFDWVYEEELSLKDGWRWSPDGARVAYWQLHTSDVQWFSLYNTTDNTPYTEVTTYPYPKVGTDNATARIGVVPAAGGATKWMATDDGSEHYIARMDWAASSEELMIQRVPREQKVIELLLTNADTGVATCVFKEEDKCWVDVRDNLKWLAEGKSFTWLSERSGFAHLYIISRDGSEMVDITAELGEADVISVVTIDDVSGFVYFMAAPATPLERYLVRAQLSTEGGGRVERVTPTGPGTVGGHSYQIAPNGSRYAVHNFSSFNDPGDTHMITLPAHKSVQLLADNTPLREKLAKVATGPTEFFTVDTRSREVPGVTSVLDGYAIFPPGFDKETAAAASLPMLVHVYGEPAGTTVTDAFGGYQHLWHLMMAQKGYVVASFDSRGTPAPKGRLWRKAAYKKIGITANNDQAAAVEATLRQWRFLDPARVGSWGWSGGGSSTLQAMFRFPDVYAAGAAVAFIADQRFYDTIYQERYMGVPPGAGGKPEEPEDGPGWSHYIEGSPITHASGLKGDLLMAYGTGDDNCHYQVRACMPAASVLRCCSEPHVGLCRRSFGPCLRANAVTNDIMPWYDVRLCIEHGGAAERAHRSRQAV